MDKETDKKWLLNFKDVLAIYDTIRFEEAKTYKKASFFTHAKGQELVPGTNKTPTHTNMACAGVLGGVKNIEILFIKIELNMKILDFNAFTDGFGAINYHEDYQKRPARDKIYEAPIGYFIKGLEPETQFITMFSCFNIDLVWEPPGFTPAEEFDAKLNVFGKPYVPDIV